MHKSLILFAFALLAQPVFSQKPEYEVTSIGFYNLENLFDTIDDPDKNDADFLPTGKLLWNSEKYKAKQANMAKVIAELGTELTPDGVAVLGVAEIENRRVLEDLVAQPAIASRNYQIVQIEGPDERGIDVGVLYQPKYFALAGAKSVRVDLTDPKTGEVDRTRDILLVSGSLPGGEALHIMVGHWPSRRGGEGKSAWMRAAAAGVCRALVDSLQTVDPQAKIVVMGDLNDDPTNKSITEVLRGRSNPKRMEASDLYNTVYDFYKAGQGTMAYRDAWSLFDQVLISKPLVSQRVGGWQFYKAVVFRRDWLVQAEGQYKGYPFRTFDGDLFINGYSDHLPVYFFMLKKKTAGK